MIKKPILTIVAISIGLFLSTAAQATLNGGIPTKPKKETHKRKEPKEKPTKKEDKKKSADKPSTYTPYTPTPTSQYGDQYHD